MNRIPDLSGLASVVARMASLPAQLKGRCLLAAGLGAVGLTTPGHALTISFTGSTGNAQADAAFDAAADRWEALFSDTVTVNINRGFSALGSGILGQAGSSQVYAPWLTTKSALINDATSASDATAVANLPGASVPLLINYTSTNPNGSGSATPYLDNNGSANNNFVWMTSANAKALGLVAANNAAVDASITFSTLFTWDFNPLDGITAGQFDFVGVATHEVGHALGFISNVDVLDANSPPNGGPYSENVFYANTTRTAFSATTLDLFRHSTAANAAMTGAIDFTAGTSDKYFSIDGGATFLAKMSTGTVHGDGRQASHFKDGLGIGIMDPTMAPGELGAISSLDIMSLDVIGWNLAPQSAPDASSNALLLLMGVTAVALFRRRK